MKSTAKELALGVVFLCLGGIVPLALYACPILASAVLLPVRENCRRSVVWSCYAAIAVLGTLLGPDKESALLFVFLGYYPIVKPRFDAIRRRPLRLAAKLLLAIAAVGAEYAFLLFVLRLVGSVLKKRFQPAHALFMAYGAQCTNREELTLADPRTAAWLRGEEIDAATAQNGWCAVLVDGFPLGGGKVSGGRIKNHYPKGLRNLQ